MKALYDYVAQRDDELTLRKNCIIHNVKKSDPGWWKGDFGGKKQHWFPANFVSEIENHPGENGEDAGNNELMPLGDMQKGSLDITGSGKALFRQKILAVFL